MAGIGKDLWNERAKIAHCMGKNVVRLTKSEAEERN